jgi:glutamate-1-semialdehyde aminotransferase
MTQLLRAVIVDDEAPARERLATLLGEHRHIAVVAQAADVPSAAEVCNREAPDVVFLDVQLRGATGFDLLPQLTVGDWKKHDNRLYEEVASGMLKRGVIMEQDSREPMFLCSALTDEDIAETQGALEESVKDALANA